MGLRAVENKMVENSKVYYRTSIVLSRNNNNFYSESFEDCSSQKCLRRQVSFGNLCDTEDSGTEKEH